MTISEDQQSWIDTFAQGDVAETFLHGISKHFKNDLLDSFEDVLNGATNSLVKFLGMDSISNELYESNRELICQLEDDLNHYLYCNSLRPTEMAIRFLPKGEMASMAESLISLTSLRRRVSKDAETVSGPVDVAVISRGEGLIWIKRKHYFNTELNPYYVQGHRGC